MSSKGKVFNPSEVAISRAVLDVLLESVKSTLDK